MFNIPHNLRKYVGTKNSEQVIFELTEFLGIFLNHGILLSNFTVIAEILVFRQILNKNYPDN